MSTTQETSVTSSEDRCTPIEAERKVTKINEETKAESEGLKLTVEELFPWVSEFKKKCRCLLAQPNIVALIRLMKFYARNVSINVNECYTKPYRAAKLKDSISETLLFFLFYYRELVEVCNRNSYLDKMSDLLAMYIDMELKASRRGKEHHSKIAARLTSCLYVYLENSFEHILDTFLKARFINRNYHDILDPVLTKISKAISASPNCDTMYVRYLLIYRLWKKVNNDAAVKNQINATAMLHLGPPPASPTPFLTKYVLPKVPKSQANSTKFLLLHKFDIEKSCRLFVQYCKENREDEDQGDIDKPIFFPNAPGSDTLEMLGGSGMCRGTSHLDNLTDSVNIPDADRHQLSSVNTNRSSEFCLGSGAAQECTKSQKNSGKHDTGEILPSKPIKTAKVLPRLKRKNAGNIVVIDLTADEITEKVIKKKKHRKLHWLVKAKKKMNTKTIKAVEKKKKNQSIATILSDDITLSGLVDSTSAGSLSTATSPEPFIFSDIADPGQTLSLSTPTLTEPENCVTSNFMENDAALVVNSVNSRSDGTSDFVEIQLTCGVTTTVTDSASTQPEQITLGAGDFIPSYTDHSLLSQQAAVKNLDSNYTNEIPDNSCHTTTQQDNDTRNTKTWTVTKLSGALSDICESYDSDNSAPDDKVGSSSKQHKSVVLETNKPTSLETLDISAEQQKLLENMTVDEASKQSGSKRSSSESSDVAVIFTRRASDIEIVDLDEYEASKADVCSSTNSITRDTGDESSIIINDSVATKLKTINDVKDLTARTEQLQLTNSSEILRIETYPDRKQPIDDCGEMQEVQERRICTVKEECFSDTNSSKVPRTGNINETEFDLQVNYSQFLQTVKGQLENKASSQVQQSEKLDIGDQQMQQNVLAKVEKIELADCDIMKHCDYKFCKGEGLSDVILTPFDALDITKKECPKNMVENQDPCIQNQCVGEPALIPKINENFICTKNEEDKICNISDDLLVNQEAGFIENIDGLSLLASVSQHVSHLEEYSETSLSKPKIENREDPHIHSEVKNYSLQGNSLGNLSVIEEVGTDDSYEILLDINVDTSTEIINEIVGVPYQMNENSLNKSGLKLENYNRSSPDVTESDSLDVVPLILETTVDLNSSMLHNNLISVENVTQMIKDSTNVIVNGETVVLFQKSPNSNFYIINKSVDGPMEYLADDKNISTKNAERNSAAIHDIVNHIPVNYSAKKLEYEDGGKIHRSKVSHAGKSKSDGRKHPVADDSLKNYENQLLSKQFTPIREKLSEHNNMYENEYIKREIGTADSSEEILTQRCTDTPGSVIELEPAKKSPPPVIRLTDTPINVQMVTSEQIHRESTPINMTTTGRSNGKLPNNSNKDKSKGTSNEHLTLKQNIKQEFENCVANSSNQISFCYERQINSNAEQLASRNFSDIHPNNLLSVNSIHSPNIPHIYSTVTTATNLYSVDHEHCDYVSCRLKVSSTQPYPSVPQSGQMCQVAHCACSKSAYQAECPPFAQRSTAATHSSYLQTNSYFVPTDPLATRCNVQEREMKLNEAALAKLHDDQLLHNIEQSIIDNKKLSQTDVKCVPEIKYKPEIDNKLPLKKRLKAHAMLSMSYEDTRIKVEKPEKVVNYPGIPMMSIAALESRNVSQSSTPLNEEKLAPLSNNLELSPRGKDDSLSNHGREMIRRDYLKDTSLTSIGNCANVDERGRKLEQQRRQMTSHMNIMTVGCQRTFKTPAQRKEIVVSSPTAPKRPAATVATHPQSPKKAKKVKVAGSGRQTRSSKRNIPKVDYSYDGVTDADPKWNTSSELKRKRKKTGR